MTNIVFFADAIHGTLLLGSSHAKVKRIQRTCRPIPAFLNSCQLAGYGGACMDRIYKKVTTPVSEMNPIKSSYKRILLVIGSNDLDNANTFWMKYAAHDPPEVQEAFIKNLCTYFRNCLDALLDAMLERFDPAPIGFVSIIVRPYWNPGICKIAHNLSNHANRYHSRIRMVKFYHNFNPELHLNPAPDHTHLNAAGYEALDRKLSFWADLHPKES